MGLPAPIPHSTLHRCWEQRLYKSEALHYGMEVEGLAELAHCCSASGCPSIRQRKQGRSNCSSQTPNEKLCPMHCHQPLDPRALGRRYGWKGAVQAQNWAKPWFAAIFSSQGSHRELRAAVGRENLGHSRKEMPSKEEHLSSWAMAIILPSPPKQLL